MERGSAQEHPIIQAATRHVFLSAKPAFNLRRKSMAKAIWGGRVIADSKDTVVVEGNEYFPLESVAKDFLKSSSHTSICPWKGTAHYYHVEVDGMKNENAAWYYPEPKPAAEEIKGRTASGKGVRVEPGTTERLTPTA